MGITATIVLALMCAIGSARVQAAAYYVATTGNDVNAGTIAAPFKTIARGSKALAAGDTLFIRQGTYAEAMIHGANGFVFRNGASKNARTRYSAYPGEEVVVKAPAGNFVVWFGQTNANIELSDLVLNGTNTVSYVVRIDGDFDKMIWAQGIRLLRNDIRYGRFGIACAADSEIIGNEIHDLRGYGMYTCGDNGLVEGNIIHDNGGYAIHHFQQNHTVNNWIFRNNVIYRNGRAYYPPYDPYFGVNRRELPAAVFLSRGQNTRFYNNLVYDNTGGVIVGLGAVNHFVANNTVYDNDKIGIDVSGANSGSLNAHVANNLTWGNGSQIANTGTGTKLEANLTTDPQVVNAAAADFHLRSGSPAINAGVNLYSLGVTKDFSGAARPQTGAFEMGAYEYGSAPAPVAFNFSLSNGGNKSVTQGASVTNSLTATLVSGTAQAVSLSCMSSAICGISST